jgi:hypothetical protein
MDGNEQSTNYNEYSYEKAITKTDKLKRVLYFIGVAFLMLLPVLIAVIFHIYFLIYITPLFIVLGVPLAKFFFRYFQTEYKYTVNRSSFKMELIHGKAKPKLLYETDIKDMDFAVPATEENVKKYGGEKYNTTAYCIVSDDSPDKYVTAFKDKNGKSVLLYFEGCKKSLKIMNYYNKNVVVSSELNH